MFSLPRPAAGRCARRTRWARIATPESRCPSTAGTGAAPGVRAGRGSQPDQHAGTGPAAGRCARRTRWARIATATPTSFRPHPQPLRPAYALGEDRNPIRWERRVCSTRLRPAYALGEDRNRGESDPIEKYGVLRPAYALGEDRNNLDALTVSPHRIPAAPGVRAGRGEDRNSCMVSRWSHRASAAPGVRAGRGSQHEDVRLVRGLPVRAAPGVRAGRGSQPDHKHVYMRDPSGLRPAYALGEDRNHALSNMPTPTVTAAPGVRAGRGSQHRRARRLQRPAHELRPAYALGEDRNRGVNNRLTALEQLRPAYALGEDRNNTSPEDAIGAIGAAPGVRAGRGSQR